MNKKLVIICNSIDRLKLIDKYYFKDEFSGEVFIVSDDRYLTVHKDILNFIDNKAKNINLKKAKQVLFMRDMYEYIKEKVQPGEYEDVIRKMLFSITFLSNIYFCRSSEDISFIVEDDIIIFKNPESLMNDGLKVCSLKGIPADNTINKKLTMFFDLIGPEAYKNIGIEREDPNFGILLDQKYKKILGQASTIWTYCPDYPKFVRDWLKLPATVKNTNINRKRKCKLYKDGFTFTLEWLTSCFLLGHGAKLFGELEVVAQGRDKTISKARDIAEGNVYAYHYTIISDEYIYKWLPVLLEQGYEEYKKQTKGLEESSRMGKYSYLNPELMDGWVIVEPKLKARVEQAKPKKVPFFLKIKSKGE